VHDNGPGIKHEDVPHIFDPYFTTKADGTGLGLALSSRIMEGHGGFIDLASAPRDNTVWACFPEAS
jgi:signal transduction histidine kinase